MFFFAQQKFPKFAHFIVWEIIWWKFGCIHTWGWDKVGARLMHGWGTGQGRGIVGALSGHLFKKIPENRIPRYWSNLAKIMPQSFPDAPAMLNP